MTKVITNVNYEIVLNLDPTRTQVVHLHHLYEYFPREKELRNLLSNYERLFNDDKTENFYNEYLKYLLSQLNQPIDSFLERQLLYDCLPIFRDTCGSYEWTRPLSCLLQTTVAIRRRIPWRVHLILVFLNPFFTLLSFPSESPVITSQRTTPSSLPRTSSINPTNLPSTSTGATPRSKNAGILPNTPRESSEKPHF